MPYYVFYGKEKELKKALMPKVGPIPIVTRRKRHGNENGNNCKLLYFIHDIDTSVLVFVF